MKKLFLLLAITFSTALLSGQLMAQDGGTDNQKGMGSQDDLDKENNKVTKERMTPEQKAYEKRIAKARKEKEKRNEVTRKKAQKTHDKRLNKAKSGVAKKKKSYVKSHNK